MPVALSDRVVVWMELSPLNTKVQVRPLGDEPPRSFTADVRGVVALTIVGSAAIVAHQETGVFYLSTIDLSNGRVDRLDQFSAGHEVFRFGECGPDDVVLVDPVSAEFRTYTLKPNPVRGPWVKIGSQLISDIRNREPASRTTPGGKSYHGAILAHKRGPDRQHFFFVAKGEKGVGQYLIRVDAEGRELARLILEFPAELKGFGPGFNAMLNSPSTMGFVHWTGALLVYGGLQ
jgi:hypothetical protein